jgi:2-oxoglutarate ferredoxin oxidoreductase subunit alpha
MHEKVLMKGNEAVGEAAILAGCRHYFGYPITPQNEIAAYMSKRMPQVGGMFLQAESELAAIHMVYGAAACGVRAMTTSSSPGISLKVEGISYLVGSDLPAVIMNIQRAGPGLGGIQPSQADYHLATKALGHGDLKVLTMAPYTIQEIADLTMDAFDLAEKYRTPVMILSDGILGQMMEPVEFKVHQIPDADKSWACTTTKGVRERNVINSMYLIPEELDALNRQRFQRYAEIEKNEVRSESYKMEDAEIVVAAYGASARVSKNAIDEARARGIKAGLLRPISLWPFPKKELQNAASKAKAFLTVEMSMGQMIDDVRLAIECSRPVYFTGRTGGLIPSQEEVLKSIEDISKEVK